jgi:hypothetical protein
LTKPARFRKPYYRIDGREGDEHPLNPEGLTELRVHGVSGAPPEDLLNDPHPMFVSGDEAAGFYRRLEPPELGPGRNVEAYSWSAISSRSRSRAFWLLLFPFAMVNHAGWMVGPKPRGSVERALIRLLGLLLTVHYALWAMVVIVDLLAYQCGSSEACRSRYLLGWFNSIREFVGPSTARLVVVFTAVPAMVILGLLWTGRGDPRIYERWAGQAGAWEIGSERVDRSGLQDPRFWQAPDFTRLLALTHSTAALAVVGATLAGVVRSLTRGSAGIGVLEGGLWAVAGACALLVVAAGRARHDSRGAGTWRRAIRAAALVAGALFAGLVWSAWGAPVASAGLAPTLGVLRNVFDGVMVAELGLILLYFAIDQIRMFAAIPLIGAALFWALSRPERAPIGGFQGLPGRLWQQWLAIGLLVALAGLAVYSVRNRLTGSVPKLDGRLPPEDPDNHLSNQFWISFGLAPVFIAAVLAIRAAPAAGSRVVAGLAGAGICVLYLMIASRVQIRHAHDYAPRWKLRVGGPGTLAAVGATALTLVSAAVIVFAAQRLGSAVPVGRGDQAGPMRSSNGGGEVLIGYYEELGWIAAAGIGSLMVFGLALGVRIAALSRFRFKPEVPRIGRRFSEHPGLSPRQRRELPARVARARSNSGLLDDLDWTVTVGIVAFLACSLSVVAGQYLRRSAEGLDRFVGFASWVLVGIAFLVIWVVRGARRDSGLRRAIGTLWEITGFFRRFHPFAPPSYGDRSVPELRNRLLSLTEGSRRVLLLAHSQGTLLCHAVLESLLTPSTRDRIERIRFVTYGSMLQRSYGRSFPHLVRVPELAELKAALEGTDGRASPTELPEPVPGAVPRWMNFGRNTDYLGGRLFVVPHRPPGCLPEEDRVDDVFFDDPPNLELPIEEPQLWGHSFNYIDGREDPRFAEHIARTLEEMANGRPDRS